MSEKTKKHWLRQPLVRELAIIVVIKLVILRAIWVLSFDESVYVDDNVIMEKLFKPSGEKNG